MVEEWLPNGAVDMFKPFIVLYLELSRLQGFKVADGRERITVTEVVVDKRLPLSCTGTYLCLVVPTLATAVKSALFLRLFSSIGNVCHPRGLTSLLALLVSGLVWSRIVTDPGPGIDTEADLDTGGWTVL